MTLPSPPLPPHAPKLPSRGVSAILTALMLAAGIALGVLIGPSPAVSLASTSRAAVVGRVLALLALGEGAGGGDGLLLSAGASHTSSTAAPPPAPSSAGNATAVGGSGQGEAGGAAAGRRGGGGAASNSSSHSSTSSSSPTSSSSESSASPTRSTTPAAGGGRGEKTKPTTPLPPIAHVWLIVLPYGTSVTNTLGQSAAAPYLDGQLAEKGTVLSDYTSLAAGQLAGAATLLSGQLAAGVSTISPPPCATAAEQGATAGQGTDTGQSTDMPCPSGEPAGVEAADAFVEAVVPKIVASATYREHGLIVITFAPASPQAASAGTASTPSPGASSTEGTGSEGAGSEVVYPAGSLTSTLTAAGAPTGALVLSPFLRHAGGRVSSAFNSLAPRVSLEGLFQAKAAGT
jgi:hypothetical protein